MTVATRYRVERLPDHREPNAWAVKDSAGKVVRLYFGHEWPSMRGDRERTAREVCAKLNAGEVVA